MLLLEVFLFAGSLEFFLADSMNWRAHFYFFLIQNEGNLCLFKIIIRKRNSDLDIFIFVDIVDKTMISLSPSPFSIFSNILNHEHSKLGSEAKGFI